MENMNRFCEFINLVAGWLLAPFRSSNLEEFFVISAGVNWNELKQIGEPTEFTRVATIGVIICFTALFAFISSLYAFICLFGDLDYIPICIMFACVWSLFIYNVDRAIVQNIDKAATEPSEIRKNRIFGLFRVLIAILLAICISTPLEVMLFKHKINPLLDEERRNKIDGFTIDMRKELAGVESEIIALDANVTKLKSSEGYTKANAYLASSEGQLNELKRIQNNQHKYFNGYHDASTEQAERDKYKALFDASKADYPDIAQQINNIKNKRVESDSEVISSDKRIKEYDEHRGRLVKRKGEIEKNIADKNNEVKNYRDTIINETSHILTNQAPKILKLKGSDFTAVLVISCLFLVVELLPLICKSMSPVGPYDLRLKEIRDTAERHKQEIVQKNKHSIDILKTLLKADADVTAEFCRTYEKIFKQRVGKFVEKKTNELFMNGKFGPIFKFKANLTDDDRIVEVEISGGDMAGIIKKIIPIVGAIITFTVIVIFLPPLAEYYQAKTGGSASVSRPHIIVICGVAATITGITYTVVRHLVGND